MKINNSFNSINIFDINKKKIKQILDLDDDTFNVLKSDYGHCLEYNTTGKSIPLFLIPLFYFFFIFINYLKKIRYSFKEKYNTKKDAFVFIMGYSKVLYSSNLNKIAGDLSYSIIYLPDFHIKSFENHLNYNKTFSENNVFYANFKISDYLKFFYFYFSKIITIIKLETSSFNKYEVGFFWKTLFRYKIYSIFSKRYFQKIDVNTKWIFEHERIIFTPIINYFKSKQINNTQLQHGVFYKPDNYFFPVYCDKVICCSEREKEHYIQYGMNGDNVLVLGAPLQTLNFFTKTLINEKNPSYDLLILLTDTTDVEYRNIQIKLLTHIFSYYNDILKVKLRFRPSSKQQDMIYLSKYISNFEISNGTSLIDDLNESKKIITFSVDSLFEILYFKKEVVIIYDNNFVDEKMISKCVSFADCIKRVDNFIKHNESIKFSDDEIVRLLGECDLQTLTNKFKLIIEKI